VRRAAILLLLTSGAVTAQRSKPAFDPETKEGLLIQYIQQEKDPGEKLGYMEQFAVQYPAHPAIAWVYDQLQPAYLQVKDYDQAMRIGALRLALEPDNLEAAKISLRAAEAKQSLEDLTKWADRTWQAAAKIAATPDAKQIQIYAEYCFYLAAKETTDLKARLRLLETLEERDPTSPYAANLPNDFLQIYRQMGNWDKALALAEKTLQSHPNNVDMLMAVAEYHSRKGDNREKVMGYTNRVIQVLADKARPAELSEDEWTKRKSQVLAAANYMGGVASSQRKQFERADAMLRAALPQLKENEEIEATALYHLGFANYKLAERGAENRAQDALKYMRLCGELKSAYQEQAIKNVGAIRAEYNLQ